MSGQHKHFSVDSEKLWKLGGNFLNSKEGAEALNTGQFKSEERLYLSLMRSTLLKTKMFLPNTSLIRAGEHFDEAYLIVSGECQVTHGQKSYTLGSGGVIGLSEGMVGFPSRYTVIAADSVHAKIIPFHKVESVINNLPHELKSILATIVKRNLTFYQSKPKT